jgi:CHAD domain-containing protein
LARRLSAFRDDDARRAAVAGVIVRLPPETRDAAQCAWNEIAGAPSGAHGADRRGVLQALVDDTERCIAATERLTLEDLTPELVAGTVRHLWRRARARAVKSWKGRDEAWLHALRKRVQQAHIALRLLRGRAGERGARLESRLDAAAKAMGSWRDLSMVRRAMDAARARGSAPPALEPLRAESLRCELEAAARARRLVRRAFQPGIGPVVRGVRCGAASP